MKVKVFVFKFDSRNMQRIVEGDINDFLKTFEKAPAIREITQSSSGSSDGNYLTVIIWYEDAPASPNAEKKDHQFDAH